MTEYDPPKSPVFKEFIPLSSPDRFENSKSLGM